jgi:hypothetical protein
MVVGQITKKHRWNVINVYGPTQHEFSQDFILELSEKLLECVGLVVIDGDFNQ